MSLHAPKHWLRSGWVVPLAAVVICPIAAKTAWLSDSGVLQRLAPVLILLWAVYILFSWFRQRDSDRMLRRAIAIAIAAVALRAIPFLQSVLDILRFRYALESGEGFVYKAAWLLAHGRAIYGPWQNPVGSIAAVYSPLYYALVAVLMKVFAPGIYLDRWLSAAAGLAIVALVWRAVCRRTDSWRASLAGCLLILALEAHEYLLLGRTDALAIAFALAGFTLFAEGIEATESIRPGRLIAVAALCFLGTMSKQSVVAAPAAVGLCLLIQRNWKGVATFSAAYAIPLAAATAVLNQMTDGRYFFLVYRLPSYATFSAEALRSHWAYVYGPYALLLLPVIAWLFYAVRDRADRALAIYLTIALVTTVSSGKSGAYNNYFLESNCLLAIAWGRMLYGLVPVLRQFRWMPGPAFGAMLLMGSFVLSYNYRSFIRPLAPFEEKSRQTEALFHLLDRIPGPVIIGDSYLEMMRGQEDNTIEWYVQRSLAPVAQTEQAAFVNDLSRRRFQAIVLERPTLTPAYRIPDAVWGSFTLPEGEAVQKNYRDLRLEEYRPEELPSFGAFAVFVPCKSACGFSGQFPDYRPETGPYRKLWEWLRAVHHPEPGRD